MNSVGLTEESCDRSEEPATRNSPWPPEADMMGAMLGDLRNRFLGLANGWVRLDGPAGTLPVDSCIEAMHSYMVSCVPANTGGYFAASQETGALVDQVRDKVGRMLGCRGEQVIFGQSTTALVFHYTRSLAQSWNEGTHIICTQLDHDSNVTPWVLAARDRGATVTMVPVNPTDGSLELADLQRALSARPVAWVAISGASNLTGFAPDLRSVVEMAHRAGARVHVDAVARAPHLPIDVNGTGIDSLATSPYKWYGPHAGCLVLQDELLRGVEPYRVRPADYDGPERWETGTKAFEVIAGIGGAADFMLEHPIEEVLRFEAGLLARMEAGLRAIPGVTVHTPLASEGRAPTTIFSVEGHHPDSVAQALAERKIAVWSGDNYACELIDALGLRAGGGAVRAGVVRHTTADEIDTLVDAVASLRS
jgi:cysteine desulfurase family protein (TIGR01976 family)